ncbi:hypothetical protein [uncultured Pontibacter sp.]|uniref:hypothetical protein n=1 Tax=uncultured Pontibacter sp. TaxID=453356 RepID=UPI00262B5513|nr:hypothetical protein [uncultured Pontibacter sp.]
MATLFHMICYNSAKVGNFGLSCGLESINLTGNGRFLAGYKAKGAAPMFLMLPLLYLLLR